MKHATSNHRVYLSVTFSTFSSLNDFNITDDNSDVAGIPRPAIFDQHISFSVLECE